MIQAARIKITTQITISFSQEFLNEPRHERQDNPYNYQDRRDENSNRNNDITEKLKIVHGFTL
jgi:hypothetical protein